MGAGDRTRYRRQRVVGIGAVGVSQLSDLLVTIVGLSLPGVVEVNPIAVAAMDALGTVPGLLLLSIAVVGAVVATTETAAEICRETRVSPLSVRLLGYAPLTCVSFVATGYNLTIIAVV